MFRRVQQGTKTEPVELLPVVWLSKSSVKGSSVKYSQAVLKMMELIPPTPAEQSGVT